MTGPTPIRGVIFDVFGTLCRIVERRSPYRQILGRRPSEGQHWLRYVLCNPVSLKDAAGAVGAQLPQRQLCAIEEDLAAEVASVVLFPEVTTVLRELRGRGLKIGLLSNLAIPYADPARRLLSDLIDVPVWSFEIGYMKPDPESYAIAAERMGMKPQELLFVGDNLLCDVEGPRSVGMKACLIDRQRRNADAQSLSNLDGILPLLSHFRDDA